MMARTSFPLRALTDPASTISTKRPRSLGAIGSSSSSRPSSTRGSSLMIQLATGPAASNAASVFSKYVAIAASCAMTPASSSASLSSAT